MTFEYAASYPTIAEQALGDRKASLLRNFSLLKEKKRCDLIREGVSIESEACEDGYEWSIVVSPEVLQLMQAKALEVTSMWPKGLVEKFRDFNALASDEPGHLIEWNSTFNADGEEVFEMWDEQKGKAIAVIRETKEFRRWISLKKWL